MTASPIVVGTDRALARELDAIERRRGQPASTGDWRDRAKNLDLTALCLSGGGIRSTAFCLGVLEALARRRMLNEFDYLSTVSGGGFIGGWLQVLLKNARDVQQTLQDLGGNELPALKRLRAFTSYLTPHAGPFSTDTWTGIVLYIRNLLLNWLIFAPVFLILAWLPIFYRTLLRALLDWWVLIPLLLVLSVLALLVSAWRAGALIPSHRAGAGFVAAEPIKQQIVAPAVAWSFVAPAMMNKSLAHPPLGWPWAAWLIPVCYMAAMLGGYGIAWRMAAPDDRIHYLLNWWRWVAATLCAAGLMVIGIWMMAPHGVLYRLGVWRPFATWPPLLGDRETALGTFGPIWFLGIHILQTTFYVAFRREASQADLDREWLGRLNAILLLLGCCWTGFAFITLVAPVLLGTVLWQDQTSWGARYTAAIGGGTTLIGFLGSWFGKQVVSGAETYLRDRSRWLQWMPTAAAVLFGIGVLVISSTFLQWTMGKLPALTARLLEHPNEGLWFITFAAQALAVVALYCLAHWFGRVNVNRYSLHAIYRNRLSRAFLGSAREDRDPDPFTGFDPADNPRFSGFRASAAGQRLFPVVNMTLNVTVSSNTALAERKAESFTATPLFCGSASLDADGAFVPTADYAGAENPGNLRGAEEGPHLGSLLTISGAAVSPNWGYHSSRLTAFLMTLFNVRLGVWLPNPATSSTEQLRLAKPDNSELALLDELRGKTTDDAQAIYLSDGGHFENLGVYEMLRRRCRRILVVDAGQDPDCAFFDLGNLIRKARIDLDVELDMLQPMHILSRSVLGGDKPPPVTPLGFACGTITYAPGETGELLYVKPSFLAGIPADVRAYGQTDMEFPQDSTLRQWFTESQFESYRALGRWQMEQIEGDGLEAMFAAARRATTTTRPDA